MRMTVFVYHQYSLDGPPHAKIFIVVLKSLQSSRNRWIFFGLRLLCCECERRHWIECESLRHIGLVCDGVFDRDNLSKWDRKTGSARPMR